MAGEKSVKSYAESKMKLVDTQQSVIKKIGKLEALGLFPGTQEEKSGSPRGNPDPNP